MNVDDTRDKLNNFILQLTIANEISLSMQNKLYAMVKGNYEHKDNETLLIKLIDVFKTLHVKDRFKLLI